MTELIHSINNPLVSVVIPVYNGEQFIAECLESVYNQTYRPLEIIIVDDGSNDNSIDVMNQIPIEKKIIQQKNGDVSRARNVGVNNATGEFVAFMDQDDIWLPQKVEQQVQIFRQNLNVDLVFTDLIKLFPNGKQHHAKDKHKIALFLTDENLFATLSRKNVLMPSAVMIRKSSFIAAGSFDESFKTCGDYELWLRMAALGMKFRYVPEPLILYRYHEKCSSKQTKTMFYDRLHAVKKTFVNGQLTAEQKKLERFALAAAYLLGAHTFFSSKDYQAFLANAQIAFSYNKRIINAKFITRYIRSWMYLHLRKK